MVAITAEGSLDLLESVALVVGLMAGIAVGLAAIAKSPIIGGPLRWIFRHIVTDPLAEWFKQLVGQAVDERITHRLNQPNGGSSLYDIGQAMKDIKQHLGLDGVDPTPGDRHNEMG